MTKLLSLNNPYLILVFIVPGFIILFVRSQFMTGRISSNSKEAILSYLTVTVIYSSLVSILVDLTGLTLRPASGLVWFGLFVFLVPIVLGLLLGINSQKDFVRDLLKRCRLKLVHPIPTAWDWKFSRMSPQWIRVTLKDNTHFTGLCSSESFISSDPNERDIYIEKVYDLGDDGTWLPPKDERGLLIVAGEIRTIEFWPYYNEKEKIDEQE